MDWKRLALMTVLEVLEELTRRLGHHDLSGQCADCVKELSVESEEPGKVG